MNTILIVSKGQDLIHSHFGTIKMNIRILHTETLERAASLFQDPNIQVMVLDCTGAMDQEIALLDLMNEKRPDMEAVLLVPEEKFIAIQQTTCRNLGRIMKPVEQIELVEAIKLALDKVQHTDLKRFTMEPDFRRRQERHFWEHLLDSVVTIDENGDCNTDFPTSFDYKHHQKVFPILFSLRRWLSSPSARERENLRYGVQILCKKKLTQVFGGAKISQYPDTLVVLLYGDARLPEEKEAYSICSEICALSETYFQCQISAYIGRPCLACELKELVEQLYFGDYQNVTAMNGVFLLPRIMMKREALTSPTLRDWMVLFSNGRKEEFYQCIRDYFTQTIAANRMDGDFLLAFQLDFTQEVGFALKQAGVPAHEIFLALERTEGKRNSARSVPDMLVWVRQVAELAMSRIENSCEAGTIAQKVCHFVCQNLNHSFTRQDLCKRLHLSESHIARTFHEEMGISISSYIAEQRTELAKEMLRNSSLPMGVVAERVGYKDYSHFYKTFKKVSGLAPADYRSQFE
ncbi:MAG: response regulator containing CheY-like receiver domain and AraC-type DNA-binding domain [Oscillospiraceae bacterium]|nr:response regulator containing CheY-like receiver domain and AraC-type DNA-binding domain [Oscillospiraceae bacterium]